MTNTLTELERLTALLPAFPEPLSEYPGFKQHKMDCGNSFSWALLDEAGISAARWFNSSGTSFPLHSHNQVELLVPYIGSMYLTIDGEDEVRIGPGESVVIPSDTAHRARFLEDTFYVAICVPRNPDWPRKATPVK